MKAICLKLVGTELDKFLLRFYVATALQFKTDALCCCLPCVPPAATHVDGAGTHTAVPVVGLPHFALPQRGLRFPKQIASGTPRSLCLKAWTLKERCPASLTLLKRSV